MNQSSLKIMLAFWPSLKKCALFFLGAVVLVIWVAADPAETVITNSRPQKPLNGDYVGALTLHGIADPINLHFTSDGSDFKATIDFPVRQQTNLQITRIRLEASKLHFEWQGQSGLMIFDGQLNDDSISGTARIGANAGSFQLVRTAKISPEILSEYAGLYEISSGKLIAISSFPDGPQYVDFDSGRTGSLFPLSETTLFAGPAYQIPAPIDIRITFRPNARQVGELIWQQGGQPERRARKIKFKKEEITFRNGDVILSGTLTLPNGPGPHPAIVRIHGAGPATRLTFADEFNAYHGIAFFSYDKRGAGKSTGDWRIAGVEELAGDAVAAVQALKSRSDIHSKQIGVAGGSEGGWVVPLVAARDKGVAFIISIAGPVLNYSDEILNEIEVGLKANGFSDDEIKQAIEFRKIVHALIASGEAFTDTGWEKIEAASRAVQNERWFGFVGPWPRNHWRWKKFQAMSRFDPQPVWEKTSVPVLALYGELDRNTPALRNVSALEAALRKAGNSDVTVITLPKANHWGLEAERGFLDGEVARLKRHVPGFLDLPVTWTLKHVDIKK